MTTQVVSRTAEIPSSSNAMTESSGSDSPLFRVKKSNKLPKSNQAYLSILLNHQNNHVFSPGELIIGVVVLTSFTPIENPIITVSFSGKVSTGVEINETTTKHKQQLFQFSQILYQSTKALPAATRSWLFKFNFPSHCTLPPTNDFQPNDQFCVRPGAGKQPLPPTCICAGSDGFGSISYKLKATLPGQILSLKSSQPIAFSPMRSFQKPPSVENRRESETKYRIGKDGKARYLIPTDVWRSKSDVKVFKYVVIAVCPTKIILDQPFPVTIKIDFSAGDLEGEVVPTLKLRYFEVDVTTETTVRIPGNQCVTIKEVRTLEDNSHSGCILPVNTAKIFNAISFRQNEMSPTFRSFSVSRKYSVSIVVGIDCMGKVWRYFFTAANMDVLPGTFHQEETLISPATAVKEDDNPPNYDDTRRTSQGAVLEEKKTKA